MEKRLLTISGTEDQKFDYEEIFDIDELVEEIRKNK